MYFWYWDGEYSKFEEYCPLIRGWFDVSKVTSVKSVHRNISRSEHGSIVVLGSKIDHGYEKKRVQ